TLSPMQGYQQLGAFGATGVLVSAAFSLVILPLLVPIPRQAGQPSLWLTRLLEKFQAWRRRRTAWLLAAIGIASLVTAAGVGRLRFEGDIARLNGITEATRRDEEAIRKTWGDALGLTLVVAHAPTLEAALVQNDRAAETLAHDLNVKSFY